MSDINIIETLKNEIAKYEDKVAKLKLALDAIEGGVEIPRARKNTGKNYIYKYRKCDNCGTQYQYVRHDSKYCHSKDCRTKIRTRTSTPVKDKGTILLEGAKK